MNKTLDNYGKPRRLYFDKLAAMSDEELLEECARMIWLSAYASNNARSDYHWQCDDCYAASEKRPGSIYKRAYDRVAAE